ncbi:hypothetical protein [Chromatocurvus halotolerans]|uniref:Uncharacterized protein n=1 Tax=Chromatocurvus halotolerans TaxID=1132028 RepID=A0A4R2L772_9GAMM|nr:hypothetical protein [Chromatocurvus halotolerans]TCO78518.1 hypothetical protein EV688_101335 [Chromatocurvus halotolerans]
MSNFEVLILGKFLLTFSVLLGIPLWQLYSLRRERRVEESTCTEDGRLDPEGG